MADRDTAQDGSGTHADAIAHEEATEIRIAYIVDLMIRLRFRRGATVRRLAAEWQLTEKRVRELTAEASKRVRAQLSDADEVAVEVLGQTLATHRAAHRAARKSLDPMAINAAVGASKLLADLVGMQGKVAPDEADTAFDPKTLSDEELERAARGEAPPKPAGAGRRRD